MSGTREWSGHLQANAVESRPLDIRPADVEHEVTTESLLEPLVDEPRSGGDTRDRAYLVEIRFVWLLFQPAKDEPRACGVYARSDGQVTHRLYDATPGDDAWSYDEDEVYASVLVDSNLQDPTPIQADQTVESLRDAYRLLIEERHLGGDRS